MSDKKDATEKRPHGVETQRSILIAAGRVFSRMAYSEARLKDIAETGKISQGSLYFHFGNKEDIARAVLNAQAERMREAMDESISREATGLSKLQGLFARVSELIAEDPLVQGGIQLAMQQEAVFDNEKQRPYREWIALARTLIEKGVQDGSVHPIADAQTTAEALTHLFIGAQVVSGVEDDWKSFPERTVHQWSIAHRILTDGAV